MWENCKWNLFKGRRKGDIARLMEGSVVDGLGGSVPPPLADASACDDALALRPFVFTGFHSPYYLPEQLRQHSRPRTRVGRTRFGRQYDAVVLMLLASSITVIFFFAPINFITANGCDFEGFRIFVRIRECEWTMNNSSRKIRSSEWHVESPPREKKRGF